MCATMHHENQSTRRFICKTAIKTGQAKLLHFGVADDDAWDVGLACGGVIDVFVEPLNW
jgi:xanthine/CO dehydrogenase XdhC/CoxF family maturation factor